LDEPSPLGIGGVFDGHGLFKQDKGLAEMGKSLSPTDILGFIA